jgi:hypothetical protein
VLPQPGKVGEAKVDHGDLVILDDLENLVGCLTRVRHRRLLLPSRSCRRNLGSVEGAAARAGDESDPLLRPFLAKTPATEITEAACVHGPSVNAPCRARVLSRANSAWLMWISVA